MRPVGDIHIYRETSQPATRFTDYHMDPPMVFTYSSRRQAWCERCCRKRWMRNLLAQVYFDAIYMFCADRAECDAAMKPRKRKARKP